MIHILCYLHGGGSAERGDSSDPLPGRSAWLRAWLAGPPACLSGALILPALFSSSPCSLRSFFLFLPQHPYLYPLLPCSPFFAHLTPSLPLTLPPATRCHPPPPRLPSQALHWIFHHKPPAACQSQRTLPPEASTEGPASDIKSGIKAKKKRQTE